MVIDNLPIVDEAVYETIVRPAEQGCSQPTDAKFRIEQLADGQFHIIIVFVCQKNSDKVKL